jgi:SDR family mycofactocin-dependent oxidoreductase
MGRFEGRVAIVTGGARGQGRAHAVALAAEGAAVAVCDLGGPEGVGAQIASVPYGLGTADDLAETGRLLAETGTAHLVRRADVRSMADMDALVADTLAAFGQIDFLIANAGICSYSTLAAMTDDIWRDMIDVNLTGCANSMRAVIPHMIDRGRGRIVATASGAGRHGMANLSHYSASKWAVIGLVKSAALELAEHGITVNAVLPSTVDTEMVSHDAAARLFRPDLEHPTQDDLHAVLRRMNPMGITWLAPEEVTHGVLFFLGEEARHVSGSTLDIGAATNAKYQ